MSPGSEKASARAVMQSSSLSPEIEAEIAAAMNDLESAAGEPPKSPARGIRGPRVVHAGREHRTGRVVSVGPTDIFVEFGPKELGVLERAQFTDDQLPKVGESLEVVVNRFESAESLYICSRPGAVQKADWEMLEPGQVVEARVTGVNKGGLELEVAGHRAFMPAGQVSFDRIEDLSTLVGEKLTCAVSRIDRSGRGNIVLSRRDVLRQEREERASKLRDTLKEGDSIEGVVRKIMPFGAFVDLGGIDGLVHISDLTHDRVMPGERTVGRYVKEGEHVRVQVLKLDWDAKRISLGIKQLVGDPFSAAANTIAEGADVTGRVVRLAEFGAFVEIAPGVEGLVHISELDWRRVAHVGDVVKQDEIITARVLKIDPDTRRISLSIKQAKPRPEPAPGEAQGASDAPAKPSKRPKGVQDRSGGFGRNRPERDTRSAEEILKETPAMRRLREKFGKMGFKGGIG